MTCERNSFGAKMPCPRCSSRSNVVKTTLFSETYREITYQCQDGCGARFVAGLSLVRLASLPEVEESAGLTLAPLEKLAPYITDRTARAA